MKQKFLLLSLMSWLFIFQGNAQFRPLTFDDMMKPILMYEKFFDECNNEMTNLLQQTQQIEPYIDRQKDPRSWERYQRYYAELKGAYDLLHERGANSNTKPHIAQLKRRFSEINSIIAAYNRRVDLANSQYQRLRYSDQRCDRYYSDISLDEFLDGKTPVVNYYEQ